VLAKAIGNPDYDSATLSHEPPIFGASLTNRRRPIAMIVRLCKCALLLGIALYFTLVVFNNTTDYDSNHQFVRHVLSMDSTFPGTRGMWRAIDRPAVHTLFYLSIICWEAVTGVLCWWGAVRMLRQLKEPAHLFDRAKSIAIIALTLGCLLWLVAFLSIGAEWFLMWQSATWNGQQAAFRMFVVLGLVLIYISLPEQELGPKV
jgi:predicted small integral membrane protein